MNGPPLLVLSAYGPPDRVFAEAIEQGCIAVVHDTELEDAIERTSALITTMHLDQVGFQRHARAVKALLARGGRLFFNGHLVVPFLPELRPFVPLARRRRQDFELVRLSDHSIFDGLDIGLLATRKGVAGFYGRGHVPPPSGAEAITGLGPDRVPVDWEWRTPYGGVIFMHAGNELWSMGEDESGQMCGLLARRVLSWCGAARLGGIGS